MTIDEFQTKPRKLTGQTLVCALVGVVFVAAALLKTVWPEDFLEAIRTSLALETRTALALGAIVIGLETGAGMALFVKPLRRIGAYVAMALLAAFTVYLIGFHSPEAPSCGCFGVASSSPVGSSVTLGVARNIAMLVGLVLVIPFHAVNHTSKENNNVCSNDS